MPEYEELRQKRNAATRWSKLERSHMRNFYAIDTETSGFKHHEPLQVAVVLFEDGRPKTQYNQYFLPSKEITDEAISVNGLTLERLQNLGAKSWSKG